MKHDLDRRTLDFLIVKFTDKRKAAHKEWLAHRENDDWMKYATLRDVVTTLEWYRGRRS